MPKQGNTPSEHGEGDPIAANDKTTVLLEAYKKHASELLAIESSEEWLLAFILGIYSADLTVVAGFVQKRELLQRLHIPLTVVALLVASFGVYYSVRRNMARRSTRQLLVNVERALGFYITDAYLHGEPLYPNCEHYTRRTFLDHGYWIILIAACAFILIVWCL